MKFIKDILFIETTTTGPDTDKDSIIQLSAILLDKDNLLEKANFNSYVRVSLLESTIHKHAQILDIPDEVMRKSSKIYEVAKKFYDQFGNDLLLATHNVQNLFFLRNAFKKANIPYDYDNHVIELWTLEYIYALSYGIKKMPTLNTLLDHFRIKQVSQSNAIERARACTIVFKKIIGHA